MKISGSTKVILGALALAAVVTGGWRLYGDFRLQSYNPTPVKPGQVVTILAMDSKDYRILIQNQVAVVAQTSGGLGTKSSGVEDGQGLKRLKMKELLQSLQGDPTGLGRLIMSLNDIKDEDIPPDEVDWKAEEVQKALNGDAALKQKLESDLHESLDGSPNTSLRLHTLLRGIVMDIPVPVQVSINGKEETLIGRVKQPFMTKIGSAMEAQIGNHFNPAQAAIVGYYRDIVQPIFDGKTPKENLADILKEKMSDGRKSTLAAPAAQILNSSTALLNEEFITGASSHSYDGPNHSTLTDLTIKLNEEGKMRMWKYSHTRSGFQLLLIVDGVAIAAPRITTELTDNNLDITQLQNQSLAEDAVKRMNDLAQKVAK